jgi:hypothetical protein
MLFLSLVVFGIDVLFFLAFSRQLHQSRRDGAYSHVPRRQPHFASRCLFYVTLIAGSGDYVLYYASILYSYHSNPVPTAPVPCFGPTLFYFNVALGSLGYVADGCLLLLLDYLFATALNTVVLIGRPRQLLFEKRLRRSGRGVVAALLFLYYVVCVQQLLAAYNDLSGDMRRHACVDHDAALAGIASSVGFVAHAAIFAYLTVSFCTLLWRNLVAAKASTSAHSAASELRHRAVSRVRLLTVVNCGALLVYSVFSGIAGPVNAPIYIPRPLFELIRNASVLLIYAVDGVAFLKLVVPSRAIDAIREPLLAQP